VEVAVDSSHLPKKVATISTVALAAILALFGGWGSSALGATTCTTDCDAATNDLERLEVAVETLSVSPLDLAGIEGEIPGADSAGAVFMSSDAAAPFLYLAPRVASLLREIFDATGEEISQGDFREVTTSPIAETVDGVDISELLDNAQPKSNLRDETDLPLLQRQMFRTDI
jgi:hypothetical protein